MWQHLFTERQTLLKPTPHEFFDLLPLIEVVVPFSINANDWAEMSDEEAVEAQGTIFDIRDDDGDLGDSHPEPDLEFGWAGRQVEQRRGLMLHGPADVGMEGRKDKLRVGVVGSAAYVDELVDWLKACSKGVTRKESRFEDLFPRSPVAAPRWGSLRR